MGSSLMIIRSVLLLFICLAIATTAQAAERAPFTFVYLMRADDPVYEPRRTYTGLSLRDKKRPLAGAKLGYKDIRIFGRALGLKFKLEEVELFEGQGAGDTVKALMGEGAFVFLLDLPLSETADLAKAMAEEEVILFNIRHYSDALRGDNCSAVLFHSLPSRAMLMDALTQFLVKKNWRDILLLQAESEEDAVIADAFEKSAKKFGLNIEDRRTLILGNDPRNRAENNVALLTADADYDAIFLADSVGEAGRYVPFSTQDPRPVVGSEGLIPAAWHWTWERHGAPQLNQRFARVVDYKMSNEDWAAWAAVRVIAEALTRGAETDAAEIRAHLTSGNFNFDTYKGEPGAFRPWNNQLRQALLLHTHNAVIARAPIAGFLHERNVLDSLGDDAPQSVCRMP